MRLLILCCFTLAGYLFAEGPEFEVASIKAFVMPKTAGAGPIRYGAVSGGPGTNDPTHQTMYAMPMRLLLMAAFELQNFQLVGGDSPDMFDFAVVIPPGATKADVRTMWRNLLVSRFGLKYHIEQREVPLDELVVGARGHKLVENPEAELSIGEGQRAVLERPGLTTVASKGANGGPLAKVTGKAQPMSALASLISTQLQSPVADKTGLTGTYDFSLEYLPQMSAGVATQVDDTSVDIRSALQQQLGLRLVKGKGMVDVVVVDKIERTPTEN